MLGPGLALAVLYLAEDQASVVTGPSLLADVVCAVLAILTLVAGVLGLLMRRATVAAAVMSISLALAVFTQTFSPQDNEVGVVVLAAVTLVLGLALLAWYEDVWRPALPHTRKAVAATLVVFVAPVFALWQSTSYLPSQNAVSVTSQLNATLVTAEDNGKHWRVTVTVKNPSQVRATIILSVLYLCERDDIPTTECPELANPIGRSWVDPGAQLEHTFSRPYGNPLLRLHFRFHYARGDRLRTPLAGSHPAPALAGSCANVTVTDLKEQSRLRALVLQPKHLIDYDDGHENFNYRIVSRENLACPAERDDDVYEYYSVTEQNVQWAGWAPAP